ncbi:MAG TPA: COQ9 family protein [Acetobacteraceae bacterium]|jgi:ubiquinone biosynthesis protein COQ9|nr:COQ9 family protein [Acetobacteraceae bacterium]
MIAPPERSRERDAAIDAMLPRVPFEGWTTRALRGGLRDIGGEPDDAALLFPGGSADMVEAYIDLADRRMAEAAAQEDLAALRVPARVRALIALRLRQQAGNKEAIRRAAALLAVPGHARLAARCTARTVDEIWHLAGDTAADFSWYTKRATLGAIYTATRLYWLQDHGEDDAATLAFLDRRLAGVARFGRLRRRCEERVGRLRPWAA